MLGRRLRQPWCLAVALALTLGWVPAASGGQAEAWHLPEMPYRLQLEVVARDRRGGINTALVDLAEQSALCRPDGADVRVLSHDGRSVPCRMEARSEGMPGLIFLVPSDARRFYAYYGSGRAERADGQWSEKLGGLYLETRPLERPIRRASGLPGAVRRTGGSFGRKPWPQISDLENPFGRDDLYLSLYEGTLYCPETGQYTFAVNCDDCAYFAIKGVRDPLCWQDGGRPSAAWRDPRKPQAVRDVRLDQGVYSIAYHHAEGRGTQLAKLGWRLPSSDAIMTVPPEAFVRYLPARIVAREVQGQPLSPFFVARHDRTLQVNGRDRGFAHYRFESRLPPASRGAGVECRWDFGDGASALGPAVEHEFPDTRAYPVTLTIADPAGRRASVTRHVSPLAGRVKDATLRLELRSRGAFVGAEEPLSVRIRVATRGAGEQAFRITTAATGRQDGAEAARTSVRATQVRSQGDEERWTELEQAFPAQDDTRTVSVSAGLHGVELAREWLRVLRSDDLLDELRLDSAGYLRGKDGALVALRLADVQKPDAPSRSLRDLDSRVVNVLVLDQLLGGPAGPGATGFAGLLGQMLEARYGGLAFHVQPAATGKGDVLSPSERFLHAVRALAQSDAHLVVVVCQPESVVNGERLGEFEQVLAATLDQVLTRSGAEALIVTAPPLPGRPRASRPYARAAKRVGLRKGVPVVDLYSRFLLEPGWERFYRLPGGGEDTLLLYPNQEGQSLIAGELYAAIVAQCHEDLLGAAAKPRIVARAREAAEGKEAERKDRRRP